MSAAALRELVDERARILPLRVNQYHAMIAAGILPEGEPYELLDGYLVRKDRSIINLPDRVIEVYTEPSRRKGRYAHSTVLRPSQRLQLPAANGRTLSVPVRTLLP